MKSREEIALAITGMVLLMASSTLPEDKKAAARHGADILLWVMDYPNNFHKVVESIKEMDLPMDAIMEDMEKLVRDYELDGTHTE